MHDEDGARARRDGSAERVEIDGPASFRVSIGIVVQRVLAEDDVVKLRDEVEERIAGPRYEHLVAGIAEQAEEKAVGLAGAGGEAEVVDSDVGAVVAVVV